MRLTSSRLLSITALFACLAVASGCSTPSIVFETTGRTLNADSARTLLAATDTSDVSSRRIAEAAKLRHETLVSLRALGEDGAAAADLITATFPTNTQAVPVRVETAVWSGVPALVLIEAYGRRSGRLDQKRLWVLDSSTGAVLFTAADR